MNLGRQKPQSCLIMYHFHKGIAKSVLPADVVARLFPAAKFQNGGTGGNGVPYNRRRRH